MIDEITIKIIFAVVASLFTLNIVFLAVFTIYSKKLHLDVKKYALLAGAVVAETAVIVAAVVVVKHSEILNILNGIQESLSMSVFVAILSSVISLVAALSAFFVSYKSPDKFNLKNQIETDFLTKDFFKKNSP